ncbi:MAG: MmcQ/YjbR family DNA-binding protein [Chloroflexota bacterium]|nr:MmcQ/YjbR family DNA-binding protein [Chloroflexota bacterium]
MSKARVTEEFPFGEDPVYKVAGKMFALIPLGEPLSISLKCDPKLVPILRETYAAVTVAPYMSKTHWNRVRVDGTIADDEVLEMIDNSYALVVKGLPKAVRDSLKP